MFGSGTRLNFTGMVFAAALAFWPGQTLAQEEDKAAGVDDRAALFNNKCARCHSLVEGKNGNGPSLFGIIGREAAALPGFKYSRALRQMAADESLIWSEENLAAFLARPSLLVPGTRMAFGGFRKEADIENLIAWIKANGGS